MRRWDFRGGLLACLLTGALTVHVHAEGSSSLLAQRELLKTYNDGALELLSKKSYGQSLALCKEGLDILGDRSDLLYIQALTLEGMEAGKASMRPKILDLLDRSLIRSDFELNSHDAAALMAARYAVKLRQAAKALSFLDSLVDGKAALKADLLRAMAYRDLGRQAEYQDQVLNGLRAFPDDLAFVRLFLTTQNPGDSAEIIRMCRRHMDRRGQELVSLEPNLILALALNLGSGEDSNSYIRLYAQGKERSLSGLAQLLFYGLISEQEALSGLAGIIRLGLPLDAEGLRRLYSSLDSQEGRQSFSKTMRGFTGNIGRNPDYDGEYSEIFSFRYGELRSYEKDDDADGNQEIHAEMVDGTCTRIIAQTASYGFRIEYRQYPEVASLGLRQTGQGLESVFSYGSMAFSLPILAFELPFGSSTLSQLRYPMIDPLCPWPTETQCLSAASERRDYGPDGEYKRFFLSFGQNTWMEEWKDGHMLLRREFRRGIPFRDEIDMDGDGRVEALQSYQEIIASPFFRKSRLSLDGDGDGVFEYSEWEYPRLRREWDYDGDGLSEAAYEREGSREWLYFASTGKGIFDVTIYLSDGQPKQVDRGGKTLALKRENDSDVFWIANIPFSIANKLPLRDGIHTINGKRILTYNFGKMLFAETIE